MGIDVKYTQLNIGCLSRNKFWGEPMDKGFRPAASSSTLIELPDGFFLLVDLGLPFEQLKQAVYNRRGVTMDKIKAVFITHFHGDHVIDINLYEQCKFYASKEEIALNQHALPISNIQPLEDNQFPGITPVLLPGHTMGTTGLAFESDGLKVLAAGDVVATKDFYRAGEVFPNAVDEKLAKESVRYAREHFDIIVPGHDVQFPTK